jgi:hypothetical protein
MIIMSFVMMDKTFEVAAQEAVSYLDMYVTKA